MQQTTKTGMPKLLVKVPWVKGRVTWSAEVVVVTNGVANVVGVEGTDPVDVDAAILLNVFKGTGSV